MNFVMKNLYEKITKRGTYVKELLEESKNPQIVDVRGWD